ncbi:uncharacterized protein [Physcomitrium patens]|uniref:Uncharacterized protein n=1 Tax=Physcomitrium patens TaxID=3218 RepID=A0A2K1KCZ5_PHYPA|nr:hypothetical protein PHYPA_010842 [Physcomitrium patens]
MSLGCLTCNASTQSFRIEETFQRSLSTHSEEGGACLIGCFARRPIHHRARAEPVHPQGSRVAPIPDAESAPRLTRCYAIRRDCTFFRDWSFNEVETATLVG